MTEPATPRRRPSRGLFLILLLPLVVAACESYEPVKPLKTREEALAARAERERRQAEATPVPEATPTPVPTATPEPTPHPDTIPPPPPTPDPEDPQPIVIRAVDMRADHGYEDAEGGWCLNAAGHFFLDNVEVPFPIREVEIEMKGEPAYDIWPAVELNMFHHDAGRNYFPFPRDFVTTDTYHLYPMVLNPPFPPGKWMFRFWYYNNFVPEGSTEDRNFYLRKITLKP